jgi:hypothetical protein
MICSWVTGTHLAVHSNFQQVLRDDRLKEKE